MSSPITPDSGSEPSNPTQPDPIPRPESRIPLLQIHHISFNQDYSCFAAGVHSGFHVFLCDPFRPLFRRDLSSSGCDIGYVSMLVQCSIFALVGSGPDPAFAPTKVVIWDDHRSRCIGELSFRSEVKSVKLRRDKIVAVLLQKIFVYNSSDLKLVHQIETASNPKGICEISQASSAMVLVCPGLQKGQVRVENYGSKRTRFVAAHDSSVASVALTQDGRVLATASTKGTLIRVFNALDGMFLQEVRRGADRAEIYSLTFSPSVQWLAVSSDKGTVHVFRLRIDSGTITTLASDRSHGTPEPHQSSGLGISSLSIFKGVLPKYFSSEWSVAQFRLPEGLQCIVAFGSQKNTVVIVGMDGSFYRCEFDPVNGGEMTQLECHNFLNAETMA